MLEKTDNTLVPKKLHAIWLGGILKEEGKQNIAKWKATNPDYEANVWIDSSTYLVGDSPEAIQQKEEYEQFKEWAKSNQINIIDINLNATDPDPDIIKRPELFTGMNSAKYYTDELKDPGSNYAAASDILRAEILYHEGGIYFDAEDVFPRNPLGQLNAEKGILVHSYGRDLLNNDLIASVPKSEFISSLRDLIKKNYEELYSQDKRYLTAHRFANLSSFRTQDGDRKTSTIRTSGPGALRKIIGYMTRENLIFPKTYWKTPDRQALSWLNNDFNSYEQVAPYFRVNLTEYFNVLITHYTYNSISDAQTRRLLHRFQDAINSKSPSNTMIELLNHVKPLFTEQEIALINNSTDNLFSKFEHHANQAEEFLLYCKYAHVSPKDLHAFIKARGDYYDDTDPMYDHPLNIIKFFHEEFSQGFFGILNLPQTPLRNNYSTWTDSFTEEEQKQLTKQVEKDMMQLRGEKSSFSTQQNKEKSSDTIKDAANTAAQSASLKHENPLKNQHKETKAPTPPNLEKENASNHDQKKTVSKHHIHQSELKISLMNTYPYGKNDSGRSHLVPAQYNGKFRKYTGDALKRKILDHFKDKIEQCSTIKELNALIKSIIVTEEFEVLKTPQRMTSAILGLKTSAIEALEDMVNDAVTQIKEKNNTQQLKDEDLISLEDDLEITDKENRDTNIPSP
ncbi:hypothetical protein ELY21_08740 [Legionella sp. km535]|uniref:TcdA/TcdB catalytic glycosyltransferase domain-containing protein n=1 Tax=Legionella sp. km535 TaxID=2498107 RepID=UPI000F8F4DB1|nr:TcdA/TcdB catalytic glycosyltransferase domain-containing protein [Legionella sp. km535]RUR18064.1 hypothetical protein ELY21_08740 [Legionella sp. km535]